MPTAPATQQAPLALLEGPQTFQVFPDSQDGKGYAQILHGTLDEHRGKLQQLNDAGMGIYFTVNQTDGKGRKAKNITTVRAYICDIDSIPDPQDKVTALVRLIRSKAPPSAVVESRNGLHCYWYTTDKEATDARQYASVNEHLIKQFSGCTQSKDLARVLRVPGFMHLKEIDHPFLVKRIIDEPKRRYTADQLKHAFPLPTEETKRTTVHFRTKEERESPDNYILTEDQAEFFWKRTLEGLANWTPVDGNKHRILLLAFGVARKFQIPQSRAEDDLHPIVARWNTRDSTEQSIIKHANWAYSNDAREANISGLRTAGVDINLKGAPRSKNWNRGKQ